MMTSSGAPVIILDRDGTIVVDRGYLREPCGLEFLPGAADGLRLFYEAGCRLIVISNQSGVGRGWLSVEELTAINRRLSVMVEAVGARLDAIYCCTHLPDAGCMCRKPQIGLLIRAAREHGFQFKNVIVVGDKESDVELGLRAVAGSIRIAKTSVESKAYRIVPDLRAAAETVIRERCGQSESLRCKALPGNKQRQQVA